MKHAVLSTDALTKFVIIASASSGTKTSQSNMMRTASASHEVRSLGRTVRAFEMVTGYYAKQHHRHRNGRDQDGAHKQSMAIGVDSPITLNALVKLFCQKYEQECVLVWNKDTDDVWLYGSDVMTQLGQHGMGRIAVSLETAHHLGWKLPDAYTIAADGSVWAVR